MKLSWLVLALAGATNPWPKGSRWNRRRAKKNGIMGLARSGAPVSFWTPCEKGEVSKTRPKRLSRVEECMIDLKKVPIPTIKCLNWKLMDSSPATECVQNCKRILQRSKQWPRKKKECDQQVNKAKSGENIERGGCKKGKKCKKGPKGPSKSSKPEMVEDEEEVVEAETLDNDSGLLFDDTFDAKEGDDEDMELDRLSLLHVDEPLFDDFTEADPDLDSPLFEDFSEEGGGGLFDDQVAESAPPAKPAAASAPTVTKIDNQSRLDQFGIGAPKPKAPPKGSKKGNKKGGKGKKGKKNSIGRYG